MRIFSSKEIVNRTRRKYQKLPEIRQRHQMERDMKIRRNQRMLVNVFSKVSQPVVLYSIIPFANDIIFILFPFTETTKTCFEGPN